MKNAAKRLVVEILAWQVRRLYKRSNFKTVVVAGSIGKTSTKHAIVATLSQTSSVLSDTGNYNALISVPLVLFGMKLPSLVNPIAWARTFIQIEKQLRRPFPYQVVVLEIGTDEPGDIAQFQKYLKADIAVVTAIAPEHMQSFRTIDAVAKEELSVRHFADELVINADLCDEKYLQLLLEKPYVTYGAAGGLTYSFTHKRQGNKFRFVAKKHNAVLTEQSLQLVADSQLSSVIAAVAVCDILGLSAADINNGILGIKPVAGRMNLLKGKNDSILIDDTYNASPEAVKAALKTLYSTKAAHKIALLGNMNELGAYSRQAHLGIGKLCNPDQLDLVVTLGPDANKYLANEAEKQGCRVERTNSPVEAGKLIADRIEKNTVVLLKGSQNGVFAEEAVKILLANSSDNSKLVRQSSEWLKIKMKWRKGIEKL